MNALLILIPLSLLLLAVAAGVFFWAVRQRQFDDLDTPEILPLVEDEEGVKNGVRSCEEEVRSCILHEPSDSVPPEHGVRSCILHEPSDSVPPEHGVRSCILHEPSDSVPP